MRDPLYSFINMRAARAEVLFSCREERLMANGQATTTASGLRFRGFAAHRDHAKKKKGKKETLWYPG